MPFAEDVIKLNAVCNACGAEAAFTKRTSDSKEIEVIGGGDIYMATCRGCFACPPTANKGQVQLILGPMFSGKSTELLRRVRRYRIAGHSCLVVKYAHDNRYSEDKVRFVYFFCFTFFA